MSLPPPPTPQQHFAHLLKTLDSLAEHVPPTTRELLLNQCQLSIHAVREALAPPVKPPETPKA